MMLSPRPWILFGAMLGLGCMGGDPILERAKELDGGSEQGTPGPGGPAGKGTATPPAPGKGAGPQPGVPDQPAPGDPNEPPPSGGQPGEEGGGQGSLGGGIKGPSVTLVGSISVEGWKSGEIRIDIFDGDQQDLTGPRPSVVGFGKLEQPGRFEVQVPETMSKVWLGAYHDEDSDGRPGASDPSGWYPGNPVLTDGKVTGLDFALERRAPPGGEME